ncbi:N-acetylneuraminate lyase [Parapedobacter composti]|uniref:N-acetylneuraminate lyase n=1 Tax=Parapedobacter composti TaxID=623281 RepID=A0A1I1JUF3_9SPHI|nr:dihydrodipicolinate synthase family protein [Parapedobacter composti]SFC51995.1 N-acetylneuraminate lyase [Parapedobacter composti]
MAKINGLIAATFSTFHADGSVDFNGIPTLVDKLVDDGLKGVFICGTNGEGPNLTVEERMAVAEAYIKAAQGRLLVLVHVGHTSVADARRLAFHAEQIGADAISAVAGFYFKPGSVGNLVACMAAIASAAPNTPFYYYHIPALTGVGMDMVEFLRLGESQIPNLAGIKYTASTLHEYQACLNYGDGKFDVLFGYDELLLSALAVGAKGAIGSTYTFAAPLYKEVIKAYNACDMATAQRLQLRLVDMIRAFVKYPPIPAQRAIMGMLGYELGRCRLPLEPLSVEQTDKLKNELDAISFFELLEDSRGSVEKRV